MARIIFHISPSGAKWTVKRDGALQTYHDTKAEAVDTGRTAARREWETFKRPSQCVVHKGDGSFEEEWTYGEDPFPPKG